MEAIPFGNGTWNPAERHLLADGAWGTEFMKRGLEQGDSPELWNLERPDAVIEVARSYVEAGSDVILTNSFGASRVLLERHGLGAKTRELNRAAAALSRRAADEAAGRTVVVAGDMGPCGKLFVMGEIEEEELLAAFSEQAAALAEGGAGWLLIETMIDRTEMAVAVRAAASTGLPVVASMTYERTSAGYRTVMGDKPEDCVADALAAGASIVGANCGTGIDAYVELTRLLRGLTGAPLWIKGNAGLPEIVGGRTVYRMGAPEFCLHVPALLAAGADIVGGCCGTSPEFIGRARPLVGRP